MLKAYILMSNEHSMILNHFRKSMLYLPIYIRAGIFRDEAFCGKEKNMEMEEEAYIEGIIDILERSSEKSNRKLAVELIKQQI